MICKGEKLSPTHHSIQKQQTSRLDLMSRVEDSREPSGSRELFGDKDRKRDRDTSQMAADRDSTRATNGKESERDGLR